MLSLRTTRVELPPGWDVRATTVKNYIVSSSSSSASLSSSLFRASNNIKLLREVRATLWRQKKVIMATDYSLGLEETELRLGLPGGVGGGGGGGEGDATKNSGKRAFAETIDLKLKLQTAAAVEEVATEEMKRSPSQKSVVACAIDPEKPSAPKAQVVGWPPVRSYRKNILAVQTEKASKEDGEKPGNSAAFVKVCMDGAPYLRKVDLKMYRSYQELSMALEKMFSSFTSANCGSQGMSGRDFMSEGKLMVLINGSEYVPTYEDKDGDWMLVGDVPWQMFVDSCKRLRIMKGSEAVGLAPRAMEKCKSRT